MATFCIDQDYSHDGDWIEQIPEFVKRASGLSDVPELLRMAIAVINQLELGWDGKKHNDLFYETLKRITWCAAYTEPEIWIEYSFDISSDYMAEKYEKRSGRKIIEQGNWFWEDEGYRGWYYQRIEKIKDYLETRARRSVSPVNGFANQDWAFRRGLIFFEYVLGPIINEFDPENELLKVGQ